MKIQGTPISNKNFTEVLQKACQIKFKKQKKEIKSNFQKLPFGGSICFLSIILTLIIDKPDFINTIWWILNIMGIVGLVFFTDFLFNQNQEVKKLSELKKLIDASLLTFSELKPKNVVTGQQLMLGREIKIPEYFMIVNLSCYYDDWLEINMDMTTVKEILSNICYGLFCEHNYKEYNWQTSPNSDSLNQEYIKWVFYLKVNQLIDLKSTKTEKSEALEKLIEQSLYQTTSNLPEPILEKSKEMTQAYFWIFSVENSLREFIKKVADKNGGLDKLKTTKQIQNSLKKKQEGHQKNRWLGVESDNFLYDIDFIHLSTIITENWRLFKSDFPNQEFIKSRIDELYQIRNMVAHTNINFNEEHLTRVKLYYNDILTQISKNQ